MRDRIAMCLLVLTLAAPAFADGPSEIRLHGKRGKLQAYVWRPAGRGPFPAIVYNHGSERDPIVGTESDVGPFFARAGFVVIFPYRRGAGKSEGPFWEDGVDKLPDDAQEQATVDLLVAENDDVVTAVEWLRAQPFVDRTHVSVAGCSFGGIESLLTAERSLALRAVVDFAGASMAWNDAPLLRERLLAAVEHARTPIFFAQAANDFNTSPSLILSAAMRAKGLPQRLRIYPPYGTTPMDGHAGFCLRGTSVWGADVLEFLR